MEGFWGIIAKVWQAFRLLGREKATLGTIPAGVAPLRKLAGGIAAGFESPPVAFGECRATSGEVWLEKAKDARLEMGSGTAPRATVPDLFVPPRTSPKNSARRIPTASTNGNKWVSIWVKTGILVSELLEQTLTEAQPRTIKVGRTYQGGFSAQSRVPFIRMAGRWLTEAGFLEGDVLQVTVVQGEIRLTRMAKPN